MDLKWTVDYRWMPGRPGKYTGQYIAECGPSRVQRVPPPPAPAQEHRLPASPLGWRFGSQMRWTSQNLAKTIDLVPHPNVLFFLDTNFFTKAIDDVVWEALLKRDIVITPLVRQELQPWLDRPDCNTMMRDEVRLAVNRGHRRVHMDYVDEALLRHGFMYYLNLLRLRKIYGFGLAQDFKRRHGRKPSKGELYGMAAPSVKDRGKLIRGRVRRSAASPTPGPTRNLLLSPLSLPLFRATKW
jgi:hypothetical protein